jgi:hypothetical protein
MLALPRATAGRNTLTKLQSSPFPPPLRQKAHGTEECVPLPRACAGGDSPARRRCEAEDGETLENCPEQFSRTPREETGDYYGDIFEYERIFPRIGPFAGRARIQFRSARARPSAAGKTGDGHGPAGAEEFPLLGPHPPGGYGEARKTARKKGGYDMELIDAVLSGGLLLIALGLLFTAAR